MLMYLIRFRKSLFIKQIQKVKMSSKFTVKFQSDQEEDLTQQFINITQTQKNNTSQANTSKKIVEKVQNNGSKRFCSNKIQKNDFFTIENLVQQGKNKQVKNKNEIITQQPIVQNVEIKSNTIRRKKVSASIKLQPLKSLRLKKDVQTIQLQHMPSLAKTMSHQIPASSTKLSKKVSQPSVCRQKMLSFQIESESSQSESSSKQRNDKQSNQILSKNELSMASLKGEEQQDQQQKNQNNAKALKQHQTSQQQLTIYEKGGLRNKSPIKQLTNQNKEAKQISRRTRKNKNLGQIREKQKQSILNQSQSYDQQAENRQVKMDNQEQINPQKKHSESDSSKESQLISETNVQKYPGQKDMAKVNLNKFLLNYLQTNNVFNLRMTRIKSFLNLFSTQFRTSFSGDNHFVMASKKTSCKPSSTFVFTSSVDNFEQNSIQYLGKMKSNIMGNIYNIYGPGLNPQNARAINASPRQLLATIVYKSQLFGARKPIQFLVYLKKQQFSYYKDFEGVQMWSDERNLADLYQSDFQNLNKIQVLSTRKPTLHPDSKQYVMNFGGKVQVSSIKNFILQDQNRDNQKVLLFGKNGEDDYVLDIHAPLSPLIGLAISMSVFDSRILSE